MKLRHIFVTLLCIQLAVAPSFFALAEGIAPCYSHTSTISAGKFLPDRQLKSSSHL